MKTIKTLLVYLFVIFSLAACAPAQHATKNGLNNLIANGITNAVNGINGALNPNMMQAAETGNLPPPLNACTHIVTEYLTMTNKLNWELSLLTKKDKAKKAKIAEQIKVLHGDENKLIGACSQNNLSPEGLFQTVGINSDTRVIKALGDENLTIRHQVLTAIWNATVKEAATIPQPAIAK